MQRAAPQFQPFYALTQPTFERNISSNHFLLQTFLTLASIVQSLHIAFRFQWLKNPYDIYHSLTMAHLDLN
jgi:hypothetical protein